MIPKRTILIFTVLFLAALACGPTVNNEDARATHAAETVAAINAQNQSNQAQPTNTNPQQQSSPAQPTNPNPQAQPTNTTPPTAQPTNTTPPTATTKPTSSTPCDKASMVSETVPDGSEFVPGEPFTKKWAIKNEGSCTWNSSYEWVFADGKNMSGPATKPITGSTVAPGKTVEVSLDLTAPNDPKTYRGTYKIRNGNGQIFTTNGFWVEIKVLQPVLGPPPMPQPPAIIHGASVVLDRTWTFDLDTTTTGPPTGADFQYAINIEQYIEPRNGAMFYFWNSPEPTYDDCLFSPLATDPILIWDPNDIGTFFCFITDQGDVGSLQIVGFDPTSMAFDYIIWGVP
jgi:hypothetical protein